MSSELGRGRCCALIAQPLQLAQPEALDLAGRGLRQLGDELDLARVLVRRQPVLDEGLQLGASASPAPGRLRSTT